MHGETLKNYQYNLQNRHKNIKLQACTKIISWLHLIQPIYPALGRMTFFLSCVILIVC